MQVPLALEQAMQRMERTMRPRESQSRTQIAQLQDSVGESEVCQFVQSGKLG